MAMCVVMTSSKGMWGSRRKREKKEVVQDIVTKPKANRRERYTPPVKPSITNVPDVDGNGLEEVLDAYLKIVEDSLDSGEFAKIVTPETIMSFIEQVPGLSDNEELTTLMASPEMRNPRQLLQTVKEGVKMIRQYFKEIISTLNDPTKLAEMFEQLPPEFTAVLEGLKSGDTSVLQKFITDLPGRKYTLPLPLFSPW